MPTSVSITNYYIPFVATTYSFACLRPLVAGLIEWGLLLFLLGEFDTPGTSIRTWPTTTMLLTCPECNNSRFYMSLVGVAYSKTRFLFYWLKGNAMKLSFNPGNDLKQYKLRRDIIIICGRRPTTCLCGPHNERTTAMHTAHNPPRCCELEKYIGGGCLRLVCPLWNVCLSHYLYVDNNNCNEGERGG